MTQFDLPLAEMRAYSPDLPAPADLDRFWSTTLAEARAHDLGRDVRAGRQRADRDRDAST